MAKAKQETKVEENEEIKIWVSAKLVEKDDACTSTKKSYLFVWNGDGFLDEDGNTVKLGTDHDEFQAADELYFWYQLSFLLAYDIENGFYFIEKSGLWRWTIVDKK